MGLMFKTLARQRLRYKGFMSVFLVLALIVSAASVLMTRLSGDLGQAAIDADMTALLQLFGIVTG
ncbi:MAG: hypothetical protein FWC20_08160, partial [Oscillospiraceae bacterium]|nr:hypothetical protein [Oscillospiraceae bacterium]MCL2279359.1 hypothetical protein [Oscillospiraceae bacterium]